MCVCLSYQQASEPIKPTTKGAPQRGGGTAEDQMWWRRFVARSSGFTWFVYLKPESVFRLAYKVRGATPILPSIFLCHVGQFQLTVGLSVFTDNTLQREN